MYDLVKTITQRRFSFYDQYLPRQAQRISLAWNTSIDDAVTNSKAVRMPQLRPCERWSFA
jgi:hypothetical protein